jgi:hypothetical protein
MGNGDAEKKCKILHALLDEAISISSGLQQGVGHCTDQELINMDGEVKDAVNDIFCALTGREVGSSFALVYPPTKCGETYPEKCLNQHKENIRMEALLEMVESLRNYNENTMLEELEQGLSWNYAQTLSKLVEERFNPEKAERESIGTEKIEKTNKHVCIPTDSDFQFYNLSSARCCICGKFMKKKIQMYVKGVPMKTTTEN